ncbi:hypothetical protein E2320_017981 [Naja naja]|nr:hypothetical protein E2320_017981 [Naja naja]
MDGWKIDRQTYINERERFFTDPVFTNRNLVTLAKSRAFREKNGRILLEGRRLISDALEAGAVPQMIFFSLMKNLKLLPAAKLKRVTLVKVKYNEIKMWSDVITPQGHFCHAPSHQNDYHP